jgi:hypothetical protein
MPVSDLDIPMIDLPILLQEIAMLSGGENLA